MIKKNGGIFGRNPTYNDVVVEGVLTLKEAQVFDNDITINGDLTVNGTETVINTVELNVDDKNITMGAVVAKVGLAATTNITAGQFTVQLADTSGLIPGMTVTKTAGTGAFGASPKIASVDSHTQITLTVAHATSGTIIFDTGGATDDTADGGGITLKGTTDKFIKWVKASVSWVFSDPIKAPDVTVDNLTASQTVFTDANKKLVTKSQTDAANAILPAQTSASGKYLKSDGTNASWDQIDVGTSDITGTLPVANGGTGAFTLTGYVKGAGTDAMTASATIPNTDITGLGTMSTQAANNVAITGGSINGTTIGATTKAAAAFTTVEANVTSTYGVATNNALKIEATLDGGSLTETGLGSLKWASWIYTAASIEAVRVSPGAGPGTDLVFRTNPNSGTDATDKIRITQDGNIKILTSGKGIDFSATSQASGMTSEIFNDYEQGTWTPVISDGTNNATMSNSNVGWYTKVGRLVTVTAYVETTSLGSVSGNLQINGLPYASQPFNTQSDLGAFASGVVGQAANLIITAGQNVGLVVPMNSTQLNLTIWNAAAGTSRLQHTNWTGAWGLVAITCTYNAA